MIESANYKLFRSLQNPQHCLSVRHIFKMKSKSYPSPFPHIEQVKVAKLLGLVLSERLHFDDHVSAVLKVCSQRKLALLSVRD